MIEIIIKEYLESVFGTDTPVFLEVPEKDNKYKKYIVLKKIDAGMINHINAATFSVYSYADSMYEAAKLSNDVKEALFDAVSLDEISSSKLGGENSNNDTQSKKYRYECIFNFYHY